MMTISELLNPAFSAAITTRVLAFLLSVTVKGTAALLLAGGLCLVFRRISAGVRHLIWTLGLAASLALPFFALVLPAYKIKVNAPYSAGTISTLVAPVAQPVNESAAGPVPVYSPAAAQTGSRPMTAGPSIAILWLVALVAAGWIVMAMRLVAAELFLRRLVRRSRPFQNSFLESRFAALCAKLGIRGPVPIRTSSEVSTAMVRGRFRPLILLPESAGGWSSEQMEIVLTHELLHVRRRDCLTQWVAQVATALYWFHPLVWLASSEMQKARERATDDALLAHGVRPVEYAEHLLELARGIQSRRLDWSAGVAMVHIPQLEVRMKALFDPRIGHRPLNGRRALMGAVLAAALLVPLAALRAEKQSGKISGVVRDPSSAVIPETLVTAVGLDRPMRIAVHTGQDGRYEFSTVPAGRYRLEFSKAGFAFTESPEIDLKPPHDVSEDVVMDLASVSEQVVVVGRAPASAHPSPATPPRRIRVGGSIQAAKLVNRTMPAYPPNAELQGIEGAVILQAVIGMNGNVLSLKPINSANESFVKSAMDAVQNWRYQPTLLNGEPVEVVTTITVSYRLSK